MKKLIAWCIIWSATVRTSYEIPHIVSDRYVLALVTTICAASWYGYTSWNTSLHAIDSYRDAFDASQRRQVGAILLSREDIQLSHMENVIARIKKVLNSASSDAVKVQTFAQYQHCEKDFWEKSLLRNELVPHEGVPLWQVQARHDEAQDQYVNIINDAERSLVMNALYQALVGGLTTRAALVGLGIGVSVIKNRSLSREIIREELPSKIECVVSVCAALPILFLLKRHAQDLQERAAIAQELQRKKINRIVEIVTAKPSYARALKARNAWVIMLADKSAQQDVRYAEWQLAEIAFGEDIAAACKNDSTVIRDVLYGGSLYGKCPPKATFEVVENDEVVVPEMCHQYSQKVQRMDEARRNFRSTSLKA